MKAAICDDQPQALEELKKMLSRIPLVKKVHTIRRWIISGPHLKKAFIMT